MPEEPEQYPPLELAGFQAWFNALSGSAEVGVCDDMTSCVIANYASSVYKQPVIVDDIGSGRGYYMVRDQPSTKRPLPEWAVERAEAFDDLHEMYGYGPDITKDEYLAYMPEELVSEDTLK